MGCILCPNPDTSSAYNTGGESCRSNSITPDGTTNAQQPQQVSPEEVIVVEPRSPRLLHRSKNMPMSPPPPREELSRGTKAVVSGKSMPRKPEPVELPTRLHTPGYADDTPSSSVDSYKSSIRRLPLKIVPSKESVDCAKRFSMLLDLTPTNSHLLSTSYEHYNELPFRVPSLSIVIRDQNNQNKANAMEQNNSIPMPKFFRSVKTKSKLYMFDKPVEEITEGSDDHGAGPSMSMQEAPAQTSEAIVYKWKMIVQLSQRKMQRRKEKMLLDGFVTTQEVLSQRNPDTTAKHGILSVTTV
ncbi:hypothetical protein ANCCEY_05112 [Ancylostoma ceylanicum]|uniref:Uncharacterized protein n=1 Tax=Ancylostoma ceylanicum TaxID=53326 RepID=A0A0D6LXA8_9BILA|nr:hypothetical protein ANCCEY_05112 [Ancylostoma ceylanicum]